mgnify:FL=1
MAFLGLNTNPKPGGEEADDVRQLRTVVALLRELGVKEYEDRDGQKLVLYERAPAPAGKK